MEAYLTKQETTLIHGVSYYIKSLKDKTQFFDPEGTAAALGISSAMWPISGMLWPSGIMLAEVISESPLNNLRILEVGCGIGLASLVASSKGADITASDYHPLTKTLLADNAALNGLPAIRYFHGDWHKPITNRGVFDLIIGSDLLYDSDNIEILATFINCHLAKNGKVILIEQRRRLANKFVKHLTAFNIHCEIEDLPEQKVNGVRLNFKRYNFSRTPTY